MLISIASTSGERKLPWSYGNPVASTNTLPIPRDFPSTISSLTLLANAKKKKRKKKTFLLLFLTYCQEDRAYPTIHQISSKKKTKKKINNTRIRECTVPSSAKIGLRTTTAASHQRCNHLNLTVADVEGEDDRRPLTPNHCRDFSFTSQHWRALRPLLLLCLMAC